jgi:hypothetical protein
MLARTQVTQGICLGIPHISFSGEEERMSFPKFAHQRARVISYERINRAILEPLESRRLFTLVPLVNPSFEDATLSDGQAELGAPDGWVFRPSEEANSTVDTYNPTATDLDGDEVPDGQNVARLHLPWCQGDLASLTQTIDETLYTAGTTYTFKLNTVLYSPQVETEFPLVVWAELLAGTQVVGWTVVDTYPMTAGEPASEVTVTSTAPANHSMLGQPLSIRIRGEASEEGPSGYIGFDNATLDATTPAPAAPTNLKAQGAAPTHIRLTWTDNSDGETGFEIQRKQPDDSWLTVHTTAVDATSWTEGDLSPGTMYTYRVRAINGGASAYSNESTAPTFANAPEIDDFEPASVVNWVPFASDGSSSTVTLLEPGHVGDGAMHVEYTIDDDTNTEWGGAGLTYGWAVSQDWTGYNSLDFYIEGGGTGRTLYLEVFDNMNSTTHSWEKFVISFADDFTGWQHKSVPFNSFVRKTVQDPGAPNDGLGLDEVWGIALLSWSDAQEFGEGSFSLDELFLTNNSPLPATPQSGQAGVADSTQVNLDWGDNTEFGVTYSVYRGTTSNFTPDNGTNRLTSGLMTSQYVDNQIPAAGMYYYKVVAVTTAGASTPTAAVQADTTVTPSTPAAPTALTFSNVTATSVAISWTDNSLNELGFVVEYSDDGGTTWDELSVGTNQRGATVTGLTADTSYSFRVSAVNGGPNRGTSTAAEQPTSADDDNTESLVVSVSDDPEPDPVLGTHPPSATATYTFSRGNTPLSESVDILFRLDFDSDLNEAEHGFDFEGAELAPNSNQVYRVAIPAGVATADVVFTPLTNNFNTEKKTIYLEVLGKGFGVGALARGPAILIKQQSGTVTQVTPTIAGLQGALLQARTSGDLITELTITSHASSGMIQLSNGEFLPTDSRGTVVIGPNQDLTTSLKNALAPNAKVALQGCHTGNNDDWFSSSGDKSLAALMSKALPGTVVSGGKRWMARVGKNTAVGAERTFVNGVEQ